jgi:deferrochelatase/peroxidase EfeB
MVLRWLYQDVAAFNRFLEEAALKVAPHLSPDEGKELLAAKLMGRWRNGTPLALSSDQPLENFSNDFAYQTQDSQGQKCPFSAHIRVTNPRDQPLNSILAPEGVPSVIRRGIPYGPEMAPGQTTDDGIDRGILGLFLCTNIRRQFYTLTHWVAENSFSPIFKGEKPPEDALFGNRNNSATSHNFLIPRAEGNVALGLPDLVHTKGTAFFLLPSMSALQALTL